MINYIIIDDEHIAHGIIKRYCDLLPNMSLKKNCYDALEAIAYLNSHSVDLIFLDLNMPKIKGFEFLKTLTSPPQVIVTTAYKEFALEGYELNIADYLLKPFSFERFLKAVNKATSQKEVSRTVVSSPQKESNATVFLKSKKKYTQVVLADILFVEASGNYVNVVTTTETITVREKLSDVIVLLPSSSFLQVHKSFIVAIKHIKNIEGNRITVKDFTIPVGKLYKMNVQKLVN